MLRIWYGIISHGYQLTASWQVDHICPLNPAIGASLISQNRHEFWVQDFFSICSSPTLWKFMEFLVQWHRISLNFVSDQGTHVTAKERKEWVHDHVTYWLLHLLQVTGLTEHWHILQKAHLKYQLKHYSSMQWLPLGVNTHTKSYVLWPQ